MNSVSTSKCRKSLALERPAAVEPCVREGCVAQGGLAGGQQQRQAPSCAVSSPRRSLPSGTGAFGPVAFSLGLLLVLPAAFPAPVLPGEDSKDVAAPHSQPLTSSERIDKHIRYILDGISALRKEVGRLGKGAEWPVCACVPLAPVCGLGLPALGGLCWVLGHCRFEANGAD